MSILSYESIKALCEQCPPLIENFDEDNFQASSYDIRIGSQCYLFDPKKKRVKEMIRELNEDEDIIIPPNQLCFIISKESVNMPNNLTAHISLKTDLIKRGIMIAAQPPIDPGYKGKIYGMLYNLSNQKVCLLKKEAILTIEFIKLDLPTNFSVQGHHMQGFNDLTKLIKDPPIESSLDYIRRLTQSYRDKIERAVPNFLIVVSILIGLLTVFATVVIYLITKR